MLIFLHIPKTAGTTFRSVINRFFKPEQILDNDTINSVYCQAHNIPISSAHLVGLGKTLGWLSPEMKQQTKCLCAHMEYGMHRHFAGPAEYITFLREPISRAISAYHHVLRDRNHQLYNEISQGRIEDFFASDLTQRNLQTRLISGIRQPSKSGDPEILEAAKERLRKDFSFFGITEMFDESMVSFSESRAGKKFAWPLVFYTKKLGCPILFYTKQNVASNYRRGEPPSRRLIEILRERNSIDVEFYKYAVELFRERMASIRGFKRKLQLYRHMNPVCMQFYDSLPPRGKKFLNNTKESLMTTPFRC